MEDARTFAWILYSLDGASMERPASFAAISQVADGINHAVPTHKELQTSLGWLQTHGLAQKESSGYSITPKGAALLASAREGNSTISQVWAALAGLLSNGLE